MKLFISLILLFISSISAKAEVIFISGSKIACEPAFYSQNPDRFKLLEEFTRNGLILLSKEQPPTELTAQEFKNMDQYKENIQIIDHEQQKYYCAHVVQHAYLRMKHANEQNRMGMDVKWDIADDFVRTTKNWLHSLNDKPYHDKQTMRDAINESLRDNKQMRDYVLYLWGDRSYHEIY